MGNLSKKLMSGATNTAVAVLMCSCYLVGCSGSSTALGLSPTSQQTEPNQLFAVELRLPSGSSSEFLPEQLGADFASDLELSKCVPTGDSALFSPAWLEDGTSTATDAAYAIYALELDGAIIPAELALTWSGTVPTGNCWIGLPNWAGQTWEWGLLPASGKITIANPGTFCDASNHTFAAVVLLGTDPAQLDLIGFGADEPGLAYPLVDTNQDKAYDDNGTVINPLDGQAFYGQDGQYDGNQPSIPITVMAQSLIT